MNLMEYTDGGVKFKVEKLGGGTPTGSVTAFAGDTAPYGWLLCDGSAISRTDYASLYSVIGTKYGSGDGSTTFNLPNLVDKFIEGGSTSGATKSAGLPNITGSAGVYLWVGERADGVFSLISRTGNPLSSSLSRDSAKLSSGFNFDASKSNAIYGASDTVQPPAIVMTYIIKA